LSTGILAAVRFMSRNMPWKIATDGMLRDMSSGAGGSGQRRAVTVARCTLLTRPMASQQANIEDPP
jgi:hypothetical protein